jgi:succinate-semialdehyde dehydrogenase/glutarate-semialdehyde dehydrogenase
MSFQAINPTTGEIFATYPTHSDAEAVDIVNQAHAAWCEWRHTSFAHRSALMKKAADLLRERSHELAVLMAHEMGKPLAAGRGEVEKCAWVCDYYAEEAETQLAEETLASDGKESFIAYNPLGVVLAVMPWNFPLWQVFRFAAPALMAGNGGILKHAANVPGCAIAIEKIFQDAGFPPDIFRNLMIGSSQVAAVIAHPHIVAVTLTGSTPAGKAVAAQAGAHLKKVVLELGGSDPYLVLADADLDLAARTCATSRLINGGQSCIAAKRFIVVESVREAFEAKFVAAMAAAKMGDPLDPDTTFGPQARHNLRNELHQQVQACITQGAKCLLGGTVPEGPGAFYPATVLTDVQPGMPAYDDELFGPVAAIISVTDEEEAIRVANGSVFGLGAAIFTADEGKGRQIAAYRLEAGCCFVNDFVKSDPRLPFGGIKESGYGRELSHLGIREFVNIKTVYVA